MPTLNLCAPLLSDADNAIAQQIISAISQGPSTLDNFEHPAFVINETRLDNARVHMFSPSHIPSYKLPIEWFSHPNAYIVSLMLRLKLIFGKPFLDITSRLTARLTDEPENLTPLRLYAARHIKQRVVSSNLVPFTQALVDDTLSLTYDTTADLQALPRTYLLALARNWQHWPTSSALLLVTPMRGSDKVEIWQDLWNNASLSAPTRAALFDHLITNLTARSMGASAPVALQALCRSNCYPPSLSISLIEALLSTYVPGGELNKLYNVLRLPPEAWQVVKDKLPLPDLHAAALATVQTMPLDVAMAILQAQPATSKHFARNQKLVRYPPMRALLLTSALSPRALLALRHSCCGDECKEIDTRLASTPEGIKLLIKRSITPSVPVPSSQLASLLHSAPPEERAQVVGAISRLKALPSPAPQPPQHGSSRNKTYPRTPSA